MDKTTPDVRTAAARRPGVKLELGATAESDAYEKDKDFERY
jgi:hypothetical protein